MKISQSFFFLLGNFGHKIIQVISFLINVSIEEIKEYMGIENIQVTFTVLYIISYIYHLFGFTQNYFSQSILRK